MNRTRVKLPAAGLVGGAVVLVAALLLAPLPIGQASAGGRALRDALHLPCFILLLVLVHALLHRCRPAAGRWALPAAMLLTALLGGASEWLQAFSSRTSSWNDFLVDLLGIAVGSATIIGSWLRGTRWFPVGLVAVAGVWLGSLWLSARPWISATKAERCQAAAFPRLGDFEEEWESYVWVPQGDAGGGPTRATFTSSNPTRGRQSLKVEARGSEWAGVRVLICRPLPWPESRSLHFDVFNPGEGFELGIRVDGFDRGRYTGQVRIAPGPNRCRLTPSELTEGNHNLTRPASFAAKAIVFHLGGGRSTGSFDLDNVRLE